MSLCYTVQINNSINNDIFTVFALQNVINAAFNFPGSYSATGVTN